MINDDTEMTMRADVKKDVLRAVRIPPPEELTDQEAEAIADWAKNFSGTYIRETDVMVSDIRPSTAVNSLEYLEEDIQERIKPLVVLAMKYGFGLRLMREPGDPYLFEITKRVIDVPVLTIPHRSMQRFLSALGILHNFSARGEIQVCIDHIEKILKRRKADAIDAGYGHYHSFAMRIHQYGVDNKAEYIVIGKERRGSYEEEEEE